MAVVSPVHPVHEQPVRSVATAAKPPSAPARPAPVPLWPRQPEDGLDSDLLARVRPSRWKNPQVSGSYDLLVLGGGAVAVATAEHAARMGVHVALATDEPLGLDVLAEALPRAVFLRSAAQVCQVRRAAATGWPDSRLGRIDFSSLIRQLADARREAAHRYAAQALADLGVAVHFGPLTFTGPSSLKVAGRTVSFSRAILSPMPRTAVPRIEGLEDLGYQTPESLGTTTELPRRWAILVCGPAGCGTTACELAQAFRRLGSAVDLIIPEARMLAEHEPMIGDLVARQFAADGIAVHCGWTCLRGQRTGAAKSLVIERAGQLKKLLADEVLIVGQRRSELGWLRLPAAGIATKEGAVETDEALRTSNPRVLALDPAGDADLLAGEAVEGLARLAVGNAAAWRPKSWRELLTPRWLRTDPLVCWLGGEGCQGEAVTSHAFPLPPDCAAGVGLALFSGTGGWLVLRVARQGRHRRRVVGATVLGPAARDLVAPLTAILAANARPTGWLSSGILDLPRLRGKAAAIPGPAWLGRLVEEALNAETVGATRWEG